MTISNDGPASMAAPSSELQQSMTTNGTISPSTAAKKLHGRAFYESIGSPKFVLAPMVDQSEFVRVPLQLLEQHALTL
jgi:tRNA-dihydrouridine synthase 1